MKKQERRQELTYSQAMAQLEEIVAQLDRGEVDVDALAGSVKEAVHLVRLCRERLRSTQAEVEQALQEMEETMMTGAITGNGMPSVARQGVPVAQKGPAEIDIFAGE